MDLKKMFNVIVVGGITSVSAAAATTGCDATRGEDAGRRFMDEGVAPFDAGFPSEGPAPFDAGHDAGSDAGDAGEDAGLDGAADGGDAGPDLDGGP